MTQLRVWILREELSDGTMEWSLNHRSVVNLDHEQMRCDGPWRIMHGCYTDETKFQEEASQEHDDLGWNSDNDDNIVSLEDGDNNGTSFFSILGFHPYKEVIFLEVGRSTVAYHFNSTYKVQYLGNLLRLRYYYRGQYESFVYTPCLTRVQGMESYKV
jgi:hypothetical protein